MICFGYLGGARRAVWFVWVGGERCRVGRRCEKWESERELKGAAYEVGERVCERGM